MKNPLAPANVKNLDLPVTPQINVSPDAAELIAQARRFDGNYCGSKLADREKAIAAYEVALKANPDKAQALQILMRIAQLHHVNYHRSKGEKPRYDSAKPYYQRIISEYPPDEPVSMQALIYMGDICVTQWRFADSLSWYNRPLEVKLDDLLKQQESLRNNPDRRAEFDRLAAKIDKLRYYQSVALKALCNAAVLMDPSLKTGLLEGILRPRSDEEVRKIVASILERGKMGKIVLFRLPPNIANISSISIASPQLAQVAAPAPVAAPVVDIKPSMAVASGAPTSQHKAITIVAILALGVVAIAGMLVFYRRFQTKPSQKTA